MARSLPLWCNYASGGLWMPHRHVLKVTNRLERMMSPDDDLSRLVVQMPPRMGKSFTSIPLFVPFYMMHNPSKHVVVLCHNSTLADEWGMQSKAIFERYVTPLTGMKISRDSHAKAKWTIEGHGGSMRATSLSSGILGVGIDGFLIIDDPYPSLESGMSPAKRAEVWNWYTGTARSRLQSGCNIVVIHQRLHPEDLIGRLLRAQNLPNATQWENLRFPAYAEEDEYLDGELFRKQGEFLCPGLIDEKLILETKALQSDYQWQCNYQQNPISPEGSLWDSRLFEEDAFVDREDAPGVYDRLVVTLDPSLGRNDKSDPQAIISLGTDKSGLFYVDAKFDRVSPGQIAVNMSEFIRNRLPQIPDAVGIEDEAAQELLFGPVMERFTADRIYTILKGMPTRKINKVTRITRISPWVEKQRIRFIRSRGSYELVEQMKAFPSKQEHDDGPDALEMAFRLLAETA